MLADDNKKYLSTSLLEREPELLQAPVEVLDVWGYLVEFGARSNIGWYDIDPAFLKVVDAPPPKPEGKEGKKEKTAAPKAEKPASKAAPAPKPTAAPAPAKPAAGKSVAEILAAARKPAGAAATPAAEAQTAAKSAKVAPGGKGMSMEEILAAARGKKPAGGAPAAATEAAPAAPPAAKPKPATAAPAAGPTKVAPGGKGMSMDEILAMARGKKPAAQAAAAPVANAPRAEQPDAEEPAAAAEATPADGGGKSLKDKITSVAEQVAYCRKVDAK